jgi:hypothetical protein
VPQDAVSRDFDHSKFVDGCICNFFVGLVVVKIVADSLLKVGGVCRKIKSKSFFALFGGQPEILLAERLGGIIYCKDNFALELIQFDRKGKGRKLAGAYGENFSLVPMAAVRADNKAAARHPTVETVGSKVPAGRKLLSALVAIIFILARACSFEISVSSKSRKQFFAVYLFF